MAADHEPITQSTRDYFASWDASSHFAISAPYQESLELVRTGGGWQIAGGALWLAQ